MSETTNTDVIEVTRGENSSTETDTPLVETNEGSGKLNVGALAIGGLLITGAVIGITKAGKWVKTKLDARHKKTDSEVVDADDFEDFQEETSTKGLDSDYGKKSQKVKDPEED